MPVRILIIEDEQLIRWSLRQKMETRDYEVTEAANGHEAAEALKNRSFDLILLDYKLPDTTGIDILKSIREDDGDVVVIMMTAYSTVENAVDAMKLGAFDYMTKPFDMERLMHVVDKALETTKLRREVRELRKQITADYGMEQIIGQDNSMQELFDTIKRIAASSASTVFLRGESGTGKDLVARVIHYQSDRAPRPFMNVTCTALSETLLESELFGHERGAFTDAKAQKKGLFELADGGTIFLDEVGDMPPALQAKLLRFLEDRTFRRVGGTTEISVDVRIIAATNRDLEEAIREGHFRSDLMYRLDVVTIYLPPLRERGEDVLLLARHFASRFAKEFRKPINSITDGGLKKLQAYPWPGNVRELKNAIERSVLLSSGTTIGAEDLVLGGHADSRTEEGNFVLPANGVDLREVEAQFIKQALSRTGNNQTQAAKLLHLSRDAFRYRLEKLGLI
ncbi:MAG: sigma-54-dependent transcriptional regulator [Phycisphaerae bacterium]